MVAFIAIGVAIVGVIRLVARDDAPYSRERMSVMIELRCAETGESWSLTRGRLEAELRARPGQLDPSHGLQSPFAAGRQTGFPMRSGVWEETISRINTEKTRLAGSGGP